MLKLGTGFDWMVTSGNAAAAFAQWGWYGLPSGPNPGLMQIVAPGRFGLGKALRMGVSNVGTEQDQANYLFPNSYEHDRWYMGFAMNVPSSGAYTQPFISVARNGTALITAALSEFGVIELWMGRYNKPLGVKLAESAGGAYFNDVWNYIELGGYLVNSTDGWATVRVNTKPVIELVSTVTQPSSLKFNSIQIGYMQNRITAISTGETSWDDGYLNDNLGVRNNTWMGNNISRVLPPAAPGDLTTWTPEPGSLANWEAASNSAVNDSQYVFTNVDGNADLYQVSPTLSAVEVFGVSVRGAYRQTDATQRSVYNIIKSGGVTEQGVEFFTPGNYAFQSDVFEVDPATGVNWLYTAVNSMQIGPMLAGFDLLDVGGGDYLDIGDGNRLRVT